MLNGLDVDEHGTRRWFVNGKRHRTDGAAVEYPDGTCEWWLNGKKHRTDGPAIEEVYGYREWWLNGKCYAFQGWLKRNTGLTAQQKTVLILKYGDG